MKASTESVLVRAVDSTEPVTVAFTGEWFGMPSVWWAVDSADQRYAVVDTRGYLDTEQVRQLVEQLQALGHKVVAGDHCPVVPTTNLMVGSQALYAAGKTAGKTAPARARRRGRALPKLLLGVALGFAVLFFVAWWLA